MGTEKGHECREKRRRRREQERPKCLDYIEGVSGGIVVTPGLESSGLGAGLPGRN